MNVCIWVIYNKHTGWRKINYVVFFITVFIFKYKYVGQWSVPFGRYIAPIRCVQRELTTLYVYTLSYIYNNTHIFYLFENRREERWIIVKNMRAYIDIKRNIFRLLFYYSVMQYIHIESIFYCCQRNHLVDIFIIFKSRLPIWNSIL